MQAAVPGVEFDAFVENFSDNWTTNFNAENVYGRMDPIYTFQNTQRRMSLSFAVPSVSVEHGLENLEKFEKLISFLYPAYELQGNGQRTVSAPPILQLKFGNLIQDQNSSSTLGAFGDNDPDPKNGLFVVVNGFSMNPNLDLGFYHPFRGQFIPKAFTVECEMGIIHRHMLGWNGSEFLGGSYPYNTRGSEVSTAKKPKQPPKPNDFKQNKQNIDSQTRKSYNEILSRLGLSEEQPVTEAEVKAKSTTARQEQIKKEQEKAILDAVEGGYIKGSVTTMRRTTTADGKTTTTATTVTYGD